MRTMIAMLIALAALAGIAMSQPQGDRTVVTLESLVADYVKSLGRDLEWNEAIDHGNVRVVRPLSRPKMEASTQATLVHELLRRRGGVIVAEGEYLLVAPERTATAIRVDAAALAACDEYAWVSHTVALPDYAAPPAWQTTACRITKAEGGLNLTGRAVDVRRWREALTAREALRAAHTREFKTPSQTPPAEIVQVLQTVFPHAQVLRAEPGLVVVTAATSQLDQLQALFEELNKE